MTTSTPEKQDGLKALNDAIDVIQSKITSLGGVFNIQMAVSFINKRIYPICQIYNKQKFSSAAQPKVVTATDEAELARQMERAEIENAEVDGDDDEEEVEGMDGDFSGGEGSEQNNKTGNLSQDEN